MSKEFTWSRGKGYECSSRGDKRFSAFYARLQDGWSIEHHYQVNVKGYNTIKEGKGKPPLNEYTPEGLYEAYKDLWREWVKDNKNEFEDLRRLAIENDYMLSDIFAHGPVNQARALSELLNEIPMDSSVWESSGKVILLFDRGLIIPPDKESHIASFLDNALQYFNGIITIYTPSKNENVDEYIEEYCAGRFIRFVRIDSLDDINVTELDYGIGMISSSKGSSLAVMRDLDELVREDNQFSYMILYHRC